MSIISGGDSCCHVIHRSFWFVRVDAAADLSEVLCSLFVAAAAAMTVVGAAAAAAADLSRI